MSAAAQHHLQNITRRRKSCRSIHFQVRKGERCLFSLLLLFKRVKEYTMVSILGSAPSWPQEGTSCNRETELTVTSDYIGNTLVLLSLHFCTTFSKVKCGSEFEESLLHRNQEILSGLKQGQKKNPTLSESCLNHAFFVWLGFFWARGLKHKSAFGRLWCKIFS